VQLISLSARVIQSQLGVQVLQLTSTGQQEVPHACHCVRTSLRNAYIVASEAAS
jgi:hypothetical protein